MRHTAWFIGGPRAGQTQKFADQPPPYIQAPKFSGDKRALTYLKDIGSFDETMEVVLYRRREWSAEHNVFWLYGLDKQSDSQVFHELLSFYSRTNREKGGAPTTKTLR